MDLHEKERQNSPDSADRPNFSLVLVLITVAAVAAYIFVADNDAPIVGNFEECVSLGNPVMESYPRQCRDTEGNLHIENIGNELEKLDLIRISIPRPNQIIESPFTISGEARGYWFFEGDFPIILVDWDGKIIAEHFATASDTWMTEEFVSFEGVLEFEKPYDTAQDTPDFMKRGTLILRKDNPSDLPEHDDALEIPVYFK